MNSYNYQYPVSELLNYGDSSLKKEWRNYIQELNLEEKHIPELISMATDLELNLADSDSVEVWASLHAWRALGQLKALPALKPLLNLLNNLDDDWIVGDLPKFCSLIGQDSIPIVSEFLVDSSNSVYARSQVVQCLTAVSVEYPETRENNIQIIVGELEKYKRNDPTLNAILIEELIDLRAFNTLDLIENAFKGKFVDIDIIGDWEDVQVEFGIVQAESITKKKIYEKLTLKSLFSLKKKVKMAEGFGIEDLSTKKKKTPKSSKKRKKR